MSDMNSSLDLAKSDLAACICKAGDANSMPTSEAESNFPLLTEEVVVLRKSNAEAQEWISNAVTYHENLNGQIEMLNAQVSSLEQEILELNSEKENATNDLQRKLDLATGDLAALNEKLYNAISSSNTNASPLIQETVLTLQKSYEEAQEWMSNALSHHEFFNIEIQNLSSTRLGRKK
mmetsp:Transcript_22233/g.31854  ORF Transcript_22233/g.31854 Transcript_22233/m.31854 type:complete len:178 (+) Transcript_22233:387-920(+)